MLGLPSDPPQSLLREVRAVLHRSQDGHEPLEIETLRGSQWMFFEERHHDVDQVLPALHGETQQRFPMVVVAGALDHRSATELLDEELESVTGARPLGD